LIKQVKIITLVGAEPFDVYICDEMESICLYVDTITEIPYTFEIPEPINIQNSFTVKVIDDNGTIIRKKFSFPYFPDPTPTPSPTSTPTPTPSPVTTTTTLYI